MANENAVEGSHLKVKLVEKNVSIKLFCIGECPLEDATGWNTMFLIFLKTMGKVPCPSILHCSKFVEHFSRNNQKVCPCPLFL